ncbi:MAG: type II toxin-antitoxin system prevent-host-death family antitoxin [Nostoc sp.]|uniref:type II toxin-antitoxin system Phd/YefM family antitoxin n=1 Tax=Nostoc sp. TaxID=1180 RepID=UPI002FFC9F50
MQQITLTEASQNLPGLIEAALSGEEIIIIKDNQPLVKLTPVSPVQHRRQPGTAKGLITISEGFDEPLEDFKEYME